jgi:hypothetical protein
MWIDNVAPIRRAVRRVLVGAAVLFTFPTGAFAEQQRDSSCTVDEATGRERMDANAKMARSGQILLPIWEEQLRLNGKVQKGEEQKPLRESLSPQDAARFEVLREKSLPVTLSQTIESSRDRDAMVVAAMSATAWQTYKTPIESKVLARFVACTEGERTANKCKIIPDDQPGEAVFAMRILFPQPDTALPNDNPTPCNIDYVLEWQQIDAINVSTPLVDRFTATGLPAFERLKAKYGAAVGGAIKKDKMTAKDRHDTEGLESEAQVVGRSIQLVYDTANIGTFWAASKVMYQSRLEDLQTYGADEASFGKTLQRRSGELEPKVNLMVGFWKMLEVSVPSNQDKLNQSNMDIIIKDMAKQSKNAPR